MGFYVPFNSPGSYCDMPKANKNNIGITLPKAGSYFFVIREHFLFRWLSFSLYDAFT